MSVRRGPPVRLESERFWEKVDKSDGDCACWPWRGAVKDTGYGLFRSAGGRTGSRGIRAHRYAYEASVAPVPPGLDLRHHCDNRLCCNPAHLEPGTRKQNMQDMVSRKRRVWRGTMGERNGLAKLTEQSVVAVRRAYSTGVTGAELAALLGVTASTICNVIKGKTWRHVPNVG